MNATLIAAVLMVLTALTHSILGERRLIVPLLALDAPLMQSALARAVIRFAWHLTSLFMLLCAALVLWPDVPNGLVRVVGWLWLGVGLFDAVATRGRHVGWPLLALAGMLTLAGATA